MAETLTEIVCFDKESNISQSIYNAKKQAIFDSLHPKNEIYVQYPGTSAPADLYNKNGITSTWQIQTSYIGAFFRASGGNADAFISSGSIAKQSSQNNYHRHTVNPHTHNMQHTHTRGTWEITGNLIFGWDLASSRLTGAFKNPVEAIGQQYDYTPYAGADYGFTMAEFSAKANWSGTTSGSLANQTNNDTTSKDNTGDSSPSTVNYNGDSSVQEGRPDNYTIRIWKRTA